MRFKIDRASLTVGGKFTVFASFFFVFEGNFPSTSPPPGGGGEADPHPIIPKVPLPGFRTVTLLNLS